MFKVFIVDDEKWVVESLKSRINWEEEGFEIVGQAYNGMEAYEKIKYIQPDLVFIDIRMPEMNGLELIGRLKEEGIDTQIIVVSGYAEFAYAQKALNYGVSGYCLKPFDEREILDRLADIKKKIKIAKFKKNSKLNDLLQISSTLLLFDRAEFEEEIKDLKNKLRGKQKVIAVSLGSQKLRIYPNIEHILIKSTENKNIYLIIIKHLDFLINYLKEQISDKIQVIGLSRPFEDMDKCENALLEADAAAHHLFFNNERGIYEAKEVLPYELMDCFEAFEESIRIKDLVSIEEYFKKVTQMLKDGKYDIRAALYIYNVTVFFISKYTVDAQIEFIDSYEKLLKLFKNVDEMIDNLKNICVRNISSKVNSALTEVKSETIKEVVRYIEENFNKPISIQTLSQKFYRNPNYLSQLFKKEMGMNFTEYLNIVRIEYACRMLQETDLPIQKISEKTGYNDYSYFTKIFKKIIGDTPGHYRESKK